MHVDPHPLLETVVLEADWPAPLGDLVAPDWLVALGRPGAASPFHDPDEVLEGPHKVAVRALLRHGGFQPSGRSKPCWEYLRGVVAKDEFPRINPAVDATNAAALHGALPISTVDRDRLVGALRIGVAPAGSGYVFNRGGQVLDTGGLLSLFDDEGPCANAVKDAQRTKTDEASRHTLTVVWGTNALPGRTERVGAWQRELFERLGATVRRID